MKILFLDIETSPNLAHVWGLWNQNVAISQLVESTQMMCFGARWEGQKRVIFKSVHHHGKKEMLETLHELMDEAEVLVGWNSAAFDHKHIKREFLEAGMLPPSPVKDLDLMRTVKQQFKFPSNKLDYVSQRLGVGQKVKHSGFDLWLQCMAGLDKAWREMRKYQIQDVNLLVDLYEKLKPWIKNHPNRALADDIPDGCVVCGSTKLHSRGYENTMTARYRKVKCADCGKWMRVAQKSATSSMRSI